MINPMDLTGKNILVTGASSGIGRETSIVLSKLGARITMIARREENLKEIYKSMAGEKHDYYVYDLSNISEIESLISDTVNKRGQFDGFAHCAGIAPMRPLSQLKEKNIDEVLKINLYSFVELVRCITKKNNMSVGSSIVGISSTASISGSKSKIAYSISKSGMDAAIRCMAKELSSKMIRVNSVQPSWVETDMLKKYIDTYGDTDHAKNSFGNQYLGPSKPYEIANLIAFLLSDATKTLTGTSILISGGSNT